MKFAAYPKYHPSRVAYLSKAPEAWDAKRLKFAARLPIKNGIGAAADTDNRELPRYVRITDIKSARTLRSDTFRSLPIELAVTASFGVGDILFACVGATFGKTYLHSSDIGPVCYAGYLARCAPRLDIDPRFISYWTESAQYRAQLDANVIQSTIQNFSAAKFKDLELALPLQVEQTAIADFLDRKTARLDTLVEKKRELIEKLKEKRTALICRTVTRGLNPNVKLKSSGVEWLGNVPQHWDVMAIRRISNRIQTGSTPPTAEERYYEEGTVSWFGPGSFGDSITLSDPVKLLNELAFKEGAARLFRECATMVVTIGATLGKVSSLAKDASCNQQITVIEYNEHRIYPRFLTYQLKRLEPTLRAIAPSATLPILSQDEIARLFVAIPSLPEQGAIVVYLDGETAKLDRMMEKVEAAIEKLQEYRTALITAAVTGKIDVRKSAGAVDLSHHTH